MRFMRSALSATIVLTSLFATSTTLPAAPIEVGVAVVEITPPKPYRMSGYFHERLSTGTHDPLLAKAVVFGQGDRRAAMVFCDLIGIPLELSVRVRELAQRQSGIEAANILLAATHTHTGPLYTGALRKHLHDEAVRQHGRDKSEEVDYPAFLVDRLVRVIGDATAAARPATLSVGTGQEEKLSFNRRFHMKGTGVVRFNPGKLNPNIIRVAGPIDPDVHVLSIKPAGGGGPVASLTVFALHLDTVGGTEFGADYPYYLAESLKEKMGPSLVSMFANGTCGDINHVDVSTRDPQQGHEEARRIGRRLAATVAGVLDDAEPIKVPSLDVRTEVIQVPLEKYTEEEIAQAKEMMKQVGSGGVPFLDRVKAYAITDVAGRKADTLAMTVQVFRLSSEVAIVALPGEVFVDLGLAIKRASPFATTMVIELAHDVPGYIPTKKAFAEGSYETVNSRIQPGGGEMLVKTALALLEELK